MTEEAILTEEDNIREAITTALANPEINSITLNNIGVDIEEAIEIIKTFCPKRNLDMFLKTFSLQKEATFIFQSPEKKITEATFKIIIKEEEGKD